MLLCIKHACFHVFSPFSAYFSPHDIIAEKGPLGMRLVKHSNKASPHRNVPFYSAAHPCGALADYQKEIAAGEMMELF